MDEYDGATVLVHLGGGVDNQVLRAPCDINTRELAQLVRLKIESRGSLRQGAVGTRRMPGTIGKEAKWSTMELNLLGKLHLKGICTIPLKLELA